MQPLDPEKRPKVHEPALNHLGLWVDDLRRRSTWLTAQGVRFAPGGIRKGPRVTTSASSTPRATTSRRWGAKAC